MYVPYKDITEHMPRPSIWWGSGIPRYKHFAPSDINVYATAALLVRARCQHCSREFMIGIAGMAPKLIKSEIELGDVADDPPYHEIEDSDDPRCTGNSMQIDISEVIEAWWRAPRMVKGGIHPDGSPKLRLDYGGAWTRLPGVERSYKRSS